MGTLNHHHQETFISCIQFFSNQLTNTLCTKSPSSILLCNNVLHLKNKQMKSCSLEKVCLVKQYLSVDPEIPRLLCVAESHRWWSASLQMTVYAVSSWACAPLLISTSSDLRQERRQTFIFKRKRGRCGILKHDLLHTEQRRETGQLQPHSG